MTSERSVLDKAFEEELSRIIKAEYGTREAFVAALEAFEEDHTDKVGLSVSDLGNRFRSDRRGFSDAERKKIVELLAAEGSSFQADEPEEIKFARSRMAGEFLVIFDLDYKPPLGHSDILLGRVLRIAPVREEKSTYRALRYDNEQSPGRKYRGTMQWYPGFNPISGLFVMEEAGRPAAPSIFMLSRIQFVEEPRDVFMFGNASGFIGDQYDEVVSVRALALPMDWFQKPEPECLTPEEIGGEAFGLIKSYLSHDMRGGKERLLTEPKLREADSGSTDLSSLCREIRTALQNYEKPTPAKK